MLHTLTMNFEAAVLKKMLTSCYKKDYNYHNKYVYMLGESSVVVNVYSSNLRIQFSYKW